MKNWNPLQKSSPTLLRVGIAGALAASLVVPIACVRAAENAVAAPNLTNTDAEAMRALLRAKIKQSEGFAESEYSVESWNALRIASSAARPIADNAGATPDELRATLADVQQKIDGLQARKAGPDLGASAGLAAWLFATERGGALNNVALHWATPDMGDAVELYRATDASGNFSKIYSGQNASFEDYGLANGAYAYKLMTVRDGKTLSSNVAPITTIALPASVSDYSNETGEGGALGEPLKVGATYYRFPEKRDGKTVNYSVQTSSDGINWTDGPVVLDKSSHADLDDFKLEANNIFYDKNSDRIVWWGHWEKSGGNYGAGRALVATAKPGERFTVHHIYNPLGIQVRDMSVFRDDDGQGYLVAASNIAGQGANATLYLFKMNADYTDVTEITNKAMEGGYREAPHIVKTGGFYYLFFSQAAGWFPSRAGYVSARSLDGQWSEARDLGNSSTFSAQSGGIMEYGATEPHVSVMQANRWIRGEGTSGNVMLPIHFANGFAFTDYSPDLLVNPAKNLIFPLHAGKLLSQNQPATASIAGSESHAVDKAFDGDYSTSFEGAQKTWPFSVTSDLGAPSKVRNVQISWSLHKGSEAYYKYTVEGSLDGKEWHVLLDRSDDKDTLVNKTYGFSSELLPDAPSVRYVRLNVLGAVLHNNPNNWYTPTLYEVKVYGQQ